MQILDEGSADFDICCLTGCMDNIDYVSTKSGAKFTSPRVRGDVPPPPFNTPTKLKPIEKVLPRTHRVTKFNSLPAVGFSGSGGHFWREDSANRSLSGRRYTALNKDKLKNTRRTRSRNLYGRHTSIGFKSFGCKISYMSQAEL